MNINFDSQNCFELPVKNSFRKFKNIWKVATGQEDDYMTSCLLNYQYFLKIQQAFEAHPKSIQQTNFVENVARKVNRNAIMFCCWRGKRNHTTFFARDWEWVWNLIYENIILV